MDIDYLLWLQTIRQALGPWIEMMFNIISYVGAGAVAVAVWLYWCRNKKEGQFLIASFGIGSALNSTIKDTLCIYRPWIRDSRIVPSSLAVGGATGYSCPSGHVNSATTIYGGIAMQKKENHKLQWAMIILIFLVALSRNYLGVHTLTDVIVSLVESILVLFGVKALFQWYEKKDRNDAMILAAGLCIVGALLAYTFLKSYPMTYENGVLLVDPADMQADAMRFYGLLSGCLIGWYFEKKYVGFQTEGLDCGMRIKRLLLGACATGAVYIAVDVICKMCFGVMCAKFMSAALAAFTALFIAPLLFGMMEKKHAEKA